MKINIENRLHGNGNLIAAARRKGVSLSGPDRRIILRNRDEALRLGYIDSTIRALEVEGELGLRGHMAFPVRSRFIGKQEGGLLGLSLRLYNIEGDHTLNNSTVGVSTLLRNRIHVGDLSLLGVWREILKEQFMIAAWTVSSAWQVFKIKLGMRP